VSVAAYARAASESCPPICVAAAIAPITTATATMARAARRELGISAVPTFVVDRALGASGAQPPDSLLEMLREGWARRGPVSVIAGGESCGVDGC
jgi:hypothetical protein